VRGDARYETATISCFYRVWNPVIKAYGFVTSFSGGNVILIEQSHQLVQKLKSSIGESTFVRIPTMYKYLAAHSFQLEEALAAIHQTATFRQQIGAKTIHEEVVHSLIVDGLVRVPNMRFQKQITYK